MGKDITNWRTVPTLRIHARMLSTDECEEQARLNETRLAECIDQDMRRYFEREICEWRRLASERQSAL